MTEEPVNFHDIRLGIVTDLDACIGCQACALNCKEWTSGTPLSNLNNPGEILINTSDVWFNRVHAIDVSTPSGELTGHFPRSCLHCERPACEEVCPTGAVTKRAEDGIVIINESFCIGCKLCSWACPYGAIEFNEISGSLQKCDMCVDRIYDETLSPEEKKPICVSSCPTDARFFGNLADPNSTVSKLVAERGGVDLIPELGYQPLNKYLPHGSPAKEHQPEPWTGATLEPAKIRSVETQDRARGSHLPEDPVDQKNRLKRPAILSTTLTGAGYGLLIWLAFFAFFGAVPPDRWFGLVSFSVAFSMIGLGLYFSMLAIGKPKLAWLSLTKWRTNWYSRHGALGLAVFGPGVAFCFCWFGVLSYGNFWRLLSGLTVFLSFGAVVSTAMLYASLRPVRAWFNPHTIRVMLCMALWSGVVWFNMFAQVFGHHTPVIGIVLIITGIATLIFKRKYWIFIDQSPSWVTPQSAFGLSKETQLKLNKSPTTEETYIHREFANLIDRQEVEKLRRRSFLFYLLLPFCAATIPVEMDVWIRISASMLGAFSVIFGIMIERWLFFAEARHTSMLYYGEETS